MLFVASFKHVSPAGAAIAAPLSDELRETYGVKPDEKLSQSALVRETVLRGLVWCFRVDVA